MNKSFRNVDEHSYSRASKIGGYAAGMLVLVWGALIISESVTSMLTNQSFVFLEGFTCARQGILAHDVKGV